MKLHRLRLLIVALGLIGLIGCDDEPWSIEHASVSGVPVEVWEYPDRSFFMAEAAFVSPKELRRRGFVDVTSADMAEYQVHQTYPGHYGVGLDDRDTAVILRRDGAWVTFVDGGLKGEFDSSGGAKAYLAEVRGWLEAGGP